MRVVTVSTTVLPGVCEEVLLLIVVSTSAAQVPTTLGTSPRVTPTCSWPRAAAPTPEPYCAKPKVVPLTPGVRSDAAFTLDEVKARPPAPPPPGPWGEPPPVFEPPLPPLARMVRFCSTVLLALPLEAPHKISAEPPAPAPPEPSFWGTKGIEVPLTSMVPALAPTLAARISTRPPPDAPELAKPPPS